MEILLGVRMTLNWSAAIVSDQSLSKDKHEKSQWLFNGAA